MTDAAKLVTAAAVAIVLTVTIAVMSGAFGGDGDKVDLEVEARVEQVVKHGVDSGMFTAGEAEQWKGDIRDALEFAPSKSEQLGYLDDLEQGIEDFENLEAEYDRGYEQYFEERP